VRKKSAKKEVQGAKEAKALGKLLRDKPEPYSTGHALHVLRAEHSRILSDAADLHRVKGRISNGHLNGSYWSRLYVCVNCVDAIRKAVVQSGKQSKPPEGK
jgi:hypothetical protein